MSRSDRVPVTTAEIVVGLMGIAMFSGFVWGLYLLVTKVLPLVWKILVKLAA